jgi:hypothetical protein
MAQVYADHRLHLKVRVVAVTDHGNFQRVNEAISNFD